MKLRGENLQKAFCLRLTRQANRGNENQEREATDLDPTAAKPAACAQPPVQGAGGRLTDGQRFTELRRRSACRTHVVSVS